MWRTSSRLADVVEPGRWALWSWAAHPARCRERVMIDDWFRVLSLDTSCSLKWEDSFAKVFSEWRAESGLDVCFELDGKVFLIEHLRMKKYTLALLKEGAEDVTMAKVITKFGLKPLEPIPALGMDYREILKRIPANRRAVVLRQGSSFEVWERLSRSDRDGTFRGYHPAFAEPVPARDAPWGAGEGGELPHDEEYIAEAAPRDILPMQVDGAASSTPSELPSPDEAMPSNPKAVEELLGEAPAAGHPVAAVPEELEGGRWINAVLKNHDVSKLLEVDNVYNLAISIDANQAEGPGKLASTVADPSLRSSKVAYELAVTLVVDDESAWKISTREQTLFVGTDGLSVGEAAFQIRPLNNGSRKLTAFIHRDGNLIQKLDVSVDVGVATPTGIKVVALREKLIFPPKGIRRDVTLIIEPEDNHYSVQAVGDAVNKFEIRLTSHELESYVNNARDALLRVVRTEDEHPSTAAEAYPFQSLIKIPEVFEQASKLQLARAGHLLFRQIFFHPLAGTQCREFGNWLIAEASAGRNVCLQINAEAFPVPWAMLYPDEVFDPDTVTWGRFLGMRCVIEQTPLRNVGFGVDPIIQEGDGGIAVSLNLNMDIDGAKGYISRQIDYWSSIEKEAPKIRLVQRTSAREILAALAWGGNDEQIVYLYCHADSVDLAAGIGPGGSSFTFTNRETITLDDLDQQAPATIQFTGSPLVFINACESGTLSPVFYSGFISYFVAKGARGVIGTECKVPALFAEEWARQFFSLFLKGDELGAVMLKLRQQFVNECGNGLGLLYGLHCNADTQVVRLAA